MTAPKTPQLELSPDEIMLVQNWRMLTVELQDHLCGMVAYISEKPENRRHQRPALRLIDCRRRS